MFYCNKNYNKYSLWPLTLFMCLFISLHLSNLLINNDGIAMSIINKKISTILAIDHIYENEFFFIFWLRYLLEPIVKIKRFYFLWIRSIFFKQIFMYLFKLYFQC